MKKKSQESSKRPGNSSAQEEEEEEEEEGSAVIGKADKLTGWRLLLTRWAKASCCFAPAAQSQFDCWIFSPAEQESNERARVETGRKLETGAAMVSLLHSLFWLVVGREVGRTPPPRAPSHHTCSCCKFISFPLCFALTFIPLFFHFCSPAPKTKAEHLKKAEKLIKFISSE